MSATRVLPVDDHRLFRAGVRRLLEERADVRVVAEAANAEEALAALATTPVDVVLMDIGLPGMGGLAALERCTRDHPQVRVSGSARCWSCWHAASRPSRSRRGWT